MAMREEHQVRIRGLAQVLRALREVLDLLPRGLPERRRVPAHQERPEVLGRACEAEEVARMHVSEDLQQQCHSIHSS